MSCKFKPFIQIFFHIEDVSAGFFLNVHGSTLLFLGKVAVKYPHSRQSLGGSAVVLSVNDKVVRVES